MPEGRTTSPQTAGHPAHNSCRPALTPIHAREMNVWSYSLYAAITRLLRWLI